MCDNWFVTCSCVCASCSLWLHIYWFIVVCCYVWPVCDFIVSCSEWTALSSCVHQSECEWGANVLLTRHCCLFRTFVCDHWVFFCRVLLRVRMLYYLKQEVIGNQAQKVLDGADSKWADYFPFITHCIFALYYFCFTTELKFPFEIAFI